MELRDRVAVVTGGASGIGRALCRRFAQEGARAVVVADRDAPGARAVADEIDGLAVATDVAIEAEVQALVERATETYGRVDVFCSNAGVDLSGGAEVSNDDWRWIIDINVMAHVYAARAIVPQMIERGEGYLVNTASAAGLLTIIGSAPYAVTKHAAVAFAEWLAIEHGDAGVRVSCLCPQGVRTGMLNEDRGPKFLLDEAIEPEVVATAVVDAMREERFLVLPHPEVLQYLQRKTGDYDRWLRGMRKLRRKIAEAGG